MDSVELDQDRFELIALNFTHIDFCSETDAAWSAVEALILSIELDYGFDTIFDGLLADQYARHVYKNCSLGADENDYEIQLSNLALQDALRIRVLNMKDRTRSLLQDDLTPVALTVHHILDGCSKKDAIDLVLAGYSEARHSLPKEVSFSNLTNTSWRTIHRKWKRFETIIPYVYMYYLFRQSYLDGEMGQSLDWFNEFPCRVWSVIRNRKLLENTDEKSVFLEF